MKTGAIRNRLIPYALSAAMLLGGISTVYAEDTSEDTARTETAQEEAGTESEQQETQEAAVPDNTASDSENTVTENNDADQSGDTDSTAEPDGPVYYTVHIGDGIENGSFLIAGQSEDLQAEENTIVYVSAVPDEGYELEKIQILGEDAQEIQTETITEDSEYSFVMPAEDVTVSGTFRKTDSADSEKTEDQKTEQKKSQKKVTMDVVDSEDQAMLSTVSNITLTMSGFIAYDAEGYGSGYDACFVVADGNYEGNSNAYCLNPAVQAPGHDSQGTAVTYNVSTDEYTDPILLKLMYYGFGGPGDITGSYASTVTARHALTHMALVKRAAELGIPGAGDYTYRASSTAIGLVDQLYAAVAAMQDVTGSVSVLTPVTDQQTIILLSKVGPSEGQLTLTKTSAYVSLTDGNACYSLKGAVYYVYSDSSCSTKAGEFTTGADGKSTETLNLAPGTYYVKEQSASKGYLLDETVYKAVVTAGSTTRVKVTEQPGNDPVTILVEKIDAETGEAGERLQGAQFTVKYYAVDAESDISGNAPSASWVFETNEKGIIRLADSYKVSGDALYTGTTGSPVLPLGFITIQETKAPEGYKLNNTVYTCSTSLENNVVSTSNLPTGENAVKETPVEIKIGTTAKDGQTGTNIGSVSSDAEIIDTISFSGTVPGRTYSMIGTLMDGVTGKQLNVENAVSEVTFTPEKTSGTVDVTFHFDASDLGGHKIVVFESMQYQGKEVASHADLNDEGQTIRYGKIQTNAVDAQTGTHTGSVSSQAIITDTVTFSGIISGRSYSLKGTLMNQATGEPLLVNGAEVTAEKDFTAESSEGSVDLVYSLDASALAGTTVVVFEDLYCNGVKVYSHADISDEGQTIHYPKIHTTATINGAKEAEANKEITLTDTISYSNVTSGQTFTVKGILMDQSTGTELLVNGSKVEAETTFTAEASDGSVDVNFTFDATGLGGRTLVVFERIFNNGVEVSSHLDLSDTEQTVVLKTTRGNITTTGGKTAKAVGTAPNTGDFTSLIFPVLSLIFGLIILVFVVVIWRKKILDDRKE